MHFHYIASQPDGKITEGDLEAQSSIQVLEHLAAKGFKPISLKVLKGVSDLGKAKLFGQKITIADKVFLTKYLALMLRVGTDLFKAIDILIADFDKPAVRSLLIELRTTLEKGQPIYSVFFKYPRYFSAVFVNLIKAGEASGNLEQVFEELSTSLQKEKELQGKIKSAIVYPVILLALSLAMITFLVTFALPKIANVFTSSNINPPGFSAIVFGVGLFLNQYIYYVLIFLVIFIFSFWYFSFKSTVGRKVMSRFFSKLPVINKVIKQMALQRFASTLKSLLKAGLQIIESLEITAQAVGNEELKDALMRVSREGIVKGLNIGEAFRREPVFPRVIVNLMSISEKAGHTESVLSTLANFYEAEIESSIKVLVSLIEPIMLIGIGLIVGTIALAIIVPIYQLVGSF